MTRTASRYAALAALVGLLLALPVQASLNKSISIDAGATSDGASTVNGKVTVITGGPGVGKTTWVESLAREFYRRSRGAGSAPRSSLKP